MNTMEELANEHKDVIFSHATGYKNNGVNMNNYFGRIYQARYLAGIAAGMRTESKKIGYVAAMDIQNSEVTGGINAFAMGVKSVNPDAKVYVKVTNTWFDVTKEKQAAEALLDLGCEGTQAKIEEVSAKIKDGSFKVFEGELKDNQGNVVCKEGEVISDADITGHMNWYFENVEVK